MQPSSGTELAAKSLLRLEPMDLVLVGPPGSGKSAVGERLAQRLQRPFTDTDALVEQLAGKSIRHIFEQDGEAAFRRWEAEVCRRISDPGGRVIACGGGAILDPAVRRQLEAGGSLVCLTAEPRALAARLDGDGSRPLLDGNHRLERLQALLAQRSAAYGSVPHQIDTTELNLDQVVERIETLPAARSVLELEAHRPEPGYRVRLGQGLLDDLRVQLEESGLAPPYVAVSDAVVAPLYGHSLGDLDLITVPAGEQHKTLDTLAHLYYGFVEAGLDRGGTVIALGGGVLLDTAGAAAASYMRGVHWVALPTTLLAMVDASLGGKVAVNLPAGKNLVGAFHPPRLVLADLRTLSSLPDPEVRAGSAEIIKAAMIGDRELFDRLSHGPSWIDREVIRRAIQVKLAIVDQDPRESGRRAALNLGHTFAHALESTSGYTLRHGEAVAIGLVAAARLAAHLGRCNPDLPDQLSQVLVRYGLPTSYTELDPRQVAARLSSDKKAVGGAPRFVLPLRAGTVEIGVEASDELVLEVLRGLRSEA